MHGGSVHAASEGEGRGSTFRVRLPLMIVHEDGSREPREHPRTEKRAPLTGLGNLTGYACSRSTTRKTRWACCEPCSKPPAPKSSRWHQRSTRSSALPSSHRTCSWSISGMPQMDGFEFIARIRGSADPAVRDTPAAALTAFARSDDRTKALQSGFEMHLAKPVDPGELVASVATLVRRAGKGR